MTSPSERTAQALKAQTRRGVHNALGFPRPFLSLPEVKRLSAHLASFREERRTLRVGILRTYTSELLRPYWSLESLLAGFDLDLYEAPLGSLLQEGLADSPLRKQEPDATLLLLKWPDLDPRFQSSLAELPESDRDELANAAERRLRSIVGPLREALPGLLVVTLLPHFRCSSLGGAELTMNGPERELTSHLKNRLAQTLRAFPASNFFDLDGPLADMGPDNFLDVRLWELAQYPFSVRGAQAVVRGLFTRACLLKGPLTKCIVLDADNTMWGGIVGEDGLEGISLGPDPPGNAYLAFQRRLLELRTRGILLALCSRNNWSDVREVLARHPHQLLRAEHFAAIRVNWDSKVKSLRSIAQELRLGLENLLFVDDSPQECLLAEQQLPEMMVVRLPQSSEEIPFCLDGLLGLERLSLTPEDADRSRYYANDHQRRGLEVQSATIEEYLAALRMVMTIGFDDLGARTRIAQLTQKTNQFNLTTRRYTEAEIDRWMRDPNYLVAHFSLADVFGESGIVGVAILRGISTPEPEFDTFLLSCRVIGRTAETAFLHSLLDVVRARGAVRVTATYVPTIRNGLVQGFWSQNGFRETRPGVFEYDLRKAGQAPESRGPIEIAFAANASAARG